MGPVHSSWQLWPWHPPAEQPDDEPAGVSYRTADEMLAKVADAADGDVVTIKIRAGVFRSLVAPHRRPEVTRGARIEDPERRATYLATIGQAEGRAWLRRCEVIPHDDNPDPRVWRLPHQAIADMTAYLLAQADEAAAQLGIPPEEMLTLGALDPPTKGRPTPDELRALVRDGMTRRAIAARYGRSLSRVDDWLRTARRERPDLNWPERRRGPRPKTPDGTRPSGNERGSK